MLVQSEVTRRPLGRGGGEALVGGRKSLCRINWRVRNYWAKMVGGVKVVALAINDACAALTPEQA